MKLARVYLAKGHYSGLIPLLEQLQASLVAPLAASSGGRITGGGSAASGSNEDAKGKATQLLEIYALKIQMYTGLKGS
jgi:hypothetical protein